MRYLVVGLGSMGKRRVRNLKAIGNCEVAGFDIRPDRREEAKKKYDIQVFEDFDKAIHQISPDGLVISTSPQEHIGYVKWAVEHDTHAFVEASVTHQKKIAELAEQIKSKPELVIAPSCTMRFFHGPRLVKQLVTENKIGEVLFINYHTGQYLPDWHPWEDIKDYYVSKKETGAAREIVPFELTWLNDIFGWPEVLTSFKSKLSDLETDIDDLYHCLLRYGSKTILNMSVEVLSRPHAVRDMTIIGSEGTISFSQERNEILLSRVGSEETEAYTLQAGNIEEQYINPEEPYIEEMKAFVEACSGSRDAIYPNSLEYDSKILGLLLEIEKMARE